MRFQSGPHQRKYSSNYAPQINAGIDFSIPAQEDHAAHVSAVLAARKSGFPVLRLPA